MNIIVLAEDHKGVERFFCKPSFDLYKDGDGTPIIKVNDAFHYPLSISEDIEFAVSTDYKGCLVLIRTNNEETEKGKYSTMYQLSFNKSDNSAFQIKDLVSMR